MVVVFPLFHTTVHYFGLRSPDNQQWKIIRKACTPQRYQRKVQTCRKSLSTVNSSPSTRGYNKSLVVQICKGNAMTLFKHEGDLFSTETIATVEPVHSQRNGPQLKINFNSGGKAPVMKSGTVDEFLAASRTAPAPAPPRALSSRPPLDQGVHSSANQRASTWSSNPRESARPEILRPAPLNL